jgi:multidrug transporter EmrE-like cation transporter
MNTDSIISAFWIIIASIAAALQVICIKKYLQAKDWYWIFLSFLSSLLVFFLYIKTFSGNNVSIIYPIIKILSIIIVIITGEIFFNNKLTIRVIGGIIFGVMSIYLLAS